MDVGTIEGFYKADMPWILPDKKLRKSPHSLWGIVATRNTDYLELNCLTPDVSRNKYRFHSESYIIVDTDTCKHQQTDLLLHSINPHELPGLYAISGVATMNHTIPDDLIRHILSVASFRAPCSPLNLFLLFDPYPTKSLRTSIHNLFMSLIVDLRFKSRFAAALASVAYRPLSTLFCAGIGTEGDTPLGFSVQILTTGSLVHALSVKEGAVALLENDDDGNTKEFLLPENHEMSTFVLPLYLTVTRAVHSNLLGASKEVKMLLQNTIVDDQNSMTPLLYQGGQHPALNCLPAAKDDEFLNSRSTKHKRLPHILKDLQYLLETPGTTLGLLCNENENDITPSFSAVWTRLLRMAQGMNSLKRKTSGGHIEYEQRERWVDAFRLSLSLAGTRDALCETVKPGLSYEAVHSALSTLIAALLKEIKYWLYCEGLLQTGLQVPGGERLPQRSTLHVINFESYLQLDCAKQVRILESQFDDVERAVLEESECKWLRVPHSPYGGSPLSFHIPLHRAIARCILAICSVPIPNIERKTNPDWWRVPILDDMETLEMTLSDSINPENCIVTWQNPSEDRQARKIRVSTRIAMAKVRHSLADHPLRCIAASQQIERYIWPRNGKIVEQMAVHYGTLQLCRTFRDLDLLLLQYIAADSPEFVLNIMLNRFSMDGYLCDLQSNGNDPKLFAKPPSLQDMDHAPLLAEAFFTSVCHLVTEIPPPPPIGDDDDTNLERALKRELVHTLATEPKSHSEAMDIALSGVEGRVGEAPTNFRAVFSRILHSIAVKKSSAGASSAPQWSLKSNIEEVLYEYDPTFWHLSRKDHQIAMENIAALRNSFLKGKDGHALPLVQVCTNYFYAQVEI